MQINKYLYHITSNPDITKLTPTIGKNASLVGETEPLVYLCDEQSIPYWMILLDSHYIFKIDMSNINTAKQYLSKVEYTLYSEYIYTKEIQSDAITYIGNIKKPEKIYMQKLCMGYIETLNKICILYAKYYTHHSKNKLYENDCCQLSKSTVAVLPHLDFSVIKTDDLIAKLKNIGEDGEYTFCDTYMNTGRRLWKQLIYYPEDDLLIYRKKIFEFINMQLINCHDTNTGGWTG